jgi:lipopolysaccharide export system permease protein
VVNEMIKRNVVGEVKPGVFYEDLSDFTMYAERVDETTQRWSNVLIHDDRDPSNPLLMLSAEARVSSGTGQALGLGLFDGTVHHANLATDNYTLATFERGEIAVGVEESIWRKNRFRSAKEEFTPRELIELARESEQKGEDPRPWYMAYHWRLGQALSPLAFAMIGVALAMQRTGGRGRAFLLSILGYVAYYVLSRLFENLGTTGKVPFLVAGQVTNVAFAAVGLVLLWRVARAGTLRG